MAKVVCMGVPFFTQPHKTTTTSSSSSSKPFKLPHRTHSTNISILSSTNNGNKLTIFQLQCYCFFFNHALSFTLTKKFKLSGSANRSVRPQKLNSDVSPHRAGIYTSIHLCSASTSIRPCLDKQLIA